MAPTISAGATIGACLGPFALASGIVLGVAISFVIKCFSDKRASHYRLHFDVANKSVWLDELEKRKKEDAQDLRNAELRGLSNEEAREKAKEWGCPETKEGRFNSHGKPKFKKGNGFITPDRDCHNGGVWKEFDKKGRRIGTLDKDGNRIKD